MGILTFNWKSVKGLLESTLLATPGNRRTVFVDLCTPELFKAGAKVNDGMVSSDDDIDPEKVPLGLVLVGDQGIYLMSGNDEDRTVVYARECNPDSMSFDEWWSAKQSLYGGDDGVDRLEVNILKEVEATIQQSPELSQTPAEDVLFCVHLSAASMRFSVQLRKPKPAVKRKPKTH